MIEALGARVLTLVRVRIGDLVISGLPSGTWRYLTPQEVDALGGEPPHPGAAARQR
jgi:16S rRNA U516 pseudouridylate synthase RsuA-like enzyme